jgi:transcriptional regulator
MENLRRLVDDHENDETGNWSMNSMTDKAIKAQMRGIVTFRMVINRLEGKFKMGQNRTTEDAQAAAQGLRRRGRRDAEAVAAEMELRVKNSSGSEG